MGAAVPDLAIALSHASRLFQSGEVEVAALQDVSLEVRRGEAVAITGPSGSGKTTLINLIAGLDRCSDGEVSVLGHHLNDLSERELTAYRARCVGLVFQEPYLLPGLTALQNVMLARLPWTSRRRLEPEARSLLQAVGLEARVGFSPAQLSGGERQRVGIARALLGRPPLLLADEPTGNLDASTTGELLEMIGRLRAEMELTLVVATHDQAVAAVAGRVLRLDGGRLR